MLAKTVLGRFLKMKTFEQKSKENFNRKTDDYEHTFDGRFTESYKSLLLEEIKINPNDSILDVACGNGKFLKMLSDKCAIKGYGVDIAEKMVENARKNCPGMTFKVGSSEHTSFQDQMFDVVTVCVALHHFPDLKAFAKEAKRILKPEGLVYIAEGHLPVVIRRASNLLIPLSKAGDVKVYSPKEIQSAFEAYGFEMTGFKRRGIYQMLIEMRKK